MRRTLWENPWPSPTYKSLVTFAHAQSLVRSVLHIVRGREQSVATPLGTLTELLELTFKRIKWRIDYEFDRMCI